MELMLFTCARSIHINTDRKELKQVLHFRFSFEPRFSEVDKSLFLAPPLRTTSCNVHYSGSILYDNERETWNKSSFVLTAQTKNNRNGLELMSNSSFNFRHLGKECAEISYFDIDLKNNTDFGFMN